MMLTQRLMIFACLGLLTAFTEPATANIVITIDEQGHGTENDNGTITTLNSRTGKDSGPGGLNGVLLYDLPFEATFGDVLLDNESGSAKLISDIVRFNSDGTIAFYSDSDLGEPPEPGDLADTATPPQAPGTTSSWTPKFVATLYGTQARVHEITMGGMDGATYIPMNADQPGFISSQFPVTYKIISDSTIGTIAEPNGVLLFSLSVLTLMALVLLRRRS